MDCIVLEWIGRLFAAGLLGRFVAAVLERNFAAVLGRLFAAMLCRRCGWE